VQKDSTARTRNSKRIPAGISQTIRASGVLKPLSKRYFMMAGNTGSVAAVPTIPNIAKVKAFQ
jgi:hypothetical protein